MKNTPPTEREIKSYANFIVDNNATIRETAATFGFSKCKIHKCVTKRLKYVDLELYKKVRKVLDQNKAERHLRGGMATREKFRKLKEN